LTGGEETTKCTSVAPALFKQQAEQIEAKIIEGLRRKRYAGV